VSILRRIPVVIGLTLAVILGAGIPASATFADSVSVRPTISTATVLAPTNFVGNLACGRPATMSATWTKSTSTRVSGYLLSVHFSDGFVQNVPLAATASSWSATIDPYYVTAYSIQYTIQTQTDYGWTKATPLSAPFQC
jgi:hypothetical protein